MVERWLPRPCWRCGRTVKVGDEWVVGHVKSRATYPELTWDVRNWAPEHRDCSNRTGQATVIEKAKRDALVEAGVFSLPAHHGESPPCPVSPPDDQDRTSDDLRQPALPGIILPIPTADDVDVLPDREWDPDALARHDWLVPLLDVPADAAPPLWMTPPPADAVGSFGAEACAWIEDTQQLTLRWWQRLTITRQLEHRDDGTLCAATFIDSAPRRAGKSVRMRGMALWRMTDPLDLWDEVQLVMHTGSDMAICREIQRQAWRWAEAHDWEVTRANGKEAIETMDGDRWLVRSQDGVYGYDTTLGLVDEGWDVKPETVTEGIEPSTLERVMPQVHLTSTAHRRATSLMPGRILGALTADDPETVLVLWGARPDADPAAPATWRAASPHWTDARARLIERKHRAALAGQADPTADDPDPLAAFSSQYLNTWRFGRVLGRTAGEPVIDASAWDALATSRPAGAPAGAAIETWFDAGVSVALAWPAGGRVVVSVTDVGTVAAAAAVIRAAGHRGRVTVGASLADHADLRRLAHDAGARGTGPAVEALAEQLAAGVLAHDAGDHLTGQVLDLRTAASTGGRRVVSKGRADAVKAATWAVAAARPALVRRRLRIITGT